MSDLMIDDYARYPQMAAFRLFRIPSRAGLAQGGISMWGCSTPRNSRPGLTHMQLRGSRLKTVIRKRVSHACETLQPRRWKIWYLDGCLM
jgi:hypothetical protein